MNDVVVYILAPAHVSKIWPKPLYGKKTVIKKLDARRYRYGKLINPLQLSPSIELFLIVVFYM